MDIEKLVPTKKQSALVVLAIALAVLLGLVLLLVEAFGEIAEAISEKEGVAAWDQAILDWAVAARDSWPTGLISWYSNTGGPIWQPIVTAVVVGILAYHPNGTVASITYPSGHTLNATVIVGTLAYLLIRYFWDRPRWVRYLIAGLALLYAVSMGLTRVYLGHHWFTDVLGGWAIGLAWVFALIGIHRVWRAVRRRSENVIEEEGARQELESGAREDVPS